MKHISILVPEGECSIVNIAGCHQIFTEVNNILHRAGKPPLFHIQLVGSKSSERKFGLYTIDPHAFIEDIRHTDLIIIPAIHGDQNKVLEVNKHFKPWLVRHYENGASIASLCVGAFLLASTGLLNGKRCATHWVEAANFRAMFPKVHLIPDRVITDEQNLLTSGGAYSWLNLVLHLVEKYAGRDIAIFCSKIFEIEPDRTSQSAFMIFEPLKKHEDDIIRRAQEFIEQNYDEKITVDELASKLAISRRNLERRFKKVTYSSIVEYIQKVRIEAAKKSFESTRENVNEVMYKVGYSDTKAFRTTFRKITGISPVEYKNKYNRQMQYS